MSSLKNLAPDSSPVPRVETGRRGWSPWLLAALASAVAALLMPRQTPFPYRYQAGQPWNYAGLKAPFDFEVLYPEAQVQADLDRVNAEHGPYFLQNNEVARRQKRQLAELVEEQARISRHDPQYEDLAANPGSYIGFGQTMLDKVFKTGIIGTESEGFRQDDPNLRVYVYAGNDERQTTLNALLTVSKAHDFLTDSLPFSPLRQPEMLLPLLDKVLVPNVFYSDSLTLSAKRHKLAAVLSTGISVRRGETIVRRNELLTPELVMKLDSLASRYNSPAGFAVLAGYGLLALLAFAGLFFRMRLTQPDLWNDRERLLLLPAIVLTGLLLVNFAQQFGAAIPLLLPLAALPDLLRRWYPAQIAWLAWGIVILLSTFALDWGAAWLALQVAGAAGAGYWQSLARNWPARMVAVLRLALIQTLVWLAAVWAGRLPDAFHTPEIALFLLVSALLVILVTQVMPKAPNEGSDTVAASL